MQTAARPVPSPNLFRGMFGNPRTLINALVELFREALKERYDALVSFERGDGALRHAAETNRGERRTQSLDWLRIPSDLGGGQPRAVTKLATHS